MIKHVLRGLSGARKYSQNHYLAEQLSEIQPEPRLEIQPEPRSWRETSGEHKNPNLPSGHINSNSYCWPSLGLENPARAEILEGDVLGTPKIEHHLVGE